MEKPKRLSLSIPQEPAMCPGPVTLIFQPSDIYIFYWSFFMNCNINKE